MLDSSHPQAEIIRNS